MRRFFITFLVSSLCLLAAPNAAALIDTNNNGISDLWEKPHNGGALFNPENPAHLPTADPDGDGWSNLLEAAAGTDPFDPTPPAGFLTPSLQFLPGVFEYPPPSEPDPDAPPPSDDPFNPDSSTTSPPTSAPPVIIEPDEIVLTWPALAGKTYQVFFSPDLSVGSWSAASAEYMGSGVAITYQAEVLNSDGTRPERLFWRVRVADTDGDSDELNDWEERLSGTDPNASETVPSIPDKWLLAHYGSGSDGSNSWADFDPTVDEDEDGLTRVQEARLGSSPTLDDTDGDGFIDAAEALAESDPNDAESTPIELYFSFKEMRTNEKNWIAGEEYYQEMKGFDVDASSYPKIFDTTGASTDSPIGTRYCQTYTYGNEIEPIWFEVFWHAKEAPSREIEKTYLVVASKIERMTDYANWDSAAPDAEEVWVNLIEVTGVSKIAIKFSPGEKRPRITVSDALNDQVRLREGVAGSHEAAMELLLEPTYVPEHNTYLTLLPVEVKQRIPDIADDGGETTYAYETVSAVPWDQPTPGVEITKKEISADQLTLTAEIYDALTDATEGGADLIPKLWINSREEPPVPGDVNGVYRLQGYSYQLFPGRNEITVSVENALGVSAHHTIVVEGDGQLGYQIVAEPPKFPEHPTYPVVYELSGASLIEEDEKITLELGGKTVEVGREEINGETDESTFRSKPFLSVNEPENATPERIAAIPSDKPVFLAELDEDLRVELQLSDNGDPVEWTSPQSGLELTSPEAVEILETGERNLTLQIKARGLGGSPKVKAVLEIYRGEAAVQDVSGDFQSAYKSAYEALADDAKTDPVAFTVGAIPVKDGFNGLSFDFEGGQSPPFQESYHTFRFDSPTKAGVRVFSADLREDTVLDGVTSRPQDIWYPLDGNADLSDFADALIASGCQVVGMTEVNACFDDAPLKRSFMVRGPPGRTFQAFDQLYTAQGRIQRSQTFGATGTNGANLADELSRVQNDAKLPASARNALGLEIAETYQFHNGFEDFVPKTHQAYVDPGTGTPQPNSWTMRGSSLPDHVQSNPTPWTVSSTVSDPARAISSSGIIKLDTTAENTAYYATTSATAPWDLNSARAVSLRFKLLEYDGANGADGAFQLAAGDGSRTWTCQVAPAQIKIQGIPVALPVAQFPNGLIDGKFHTLQINLSGTGNDAIVSIDGEVLSATAAAQTGTLNGIAFGDPGPGIAGKLEVETLGFENSDLRYQYGYLADEYADSDEIADINNVLLYLRSKGQAFRVSPIAKWIRILDPNVHEWLLETYTGRSKLGYDKELHILANKDVWFGSTVSVSESETYASRWPWAKKTKVTSTLVLDKEETKIWSTDQTRNEMQLAGILMAWTYEQQPYKVWLAEKEGGGTGIDGILIERKHLVENIVKCAKGVETTLELGGEIAISMTNEFADYAITINHVRQGDYMAMVGFIPLVPSSTAKAFKFLNKADGTTIEAIHQLSTKLNDFPSGIHSYVDDHGITRKLDFDKLFCDAADAEAVQRLRALTSNLPVSAHRPGLVSGKEVLSTFSNGSVTLFKTKEPLKVYRVYKDGGTLESNFFLFEKPQSLKQAVADQALMNPQTGVPWQNYDRYVEVEIPADQYVYLGYASKMTDTAPGGGTQIWVDDVTVSDIDWVAAASAATVLPP